MASKQHKLLEKTKHRVHRPHLLLQQPAILAPRRRKHDQRRQGRTGKLELLRIYRAIWARFQLRHLLNHNLHNNLRTARVLGREGPLRDGVDLQSLPSATRRQARRPGLHLYQTRQRRVRKVSRRLQVSNIKVWQGDSRQHLRRQRRLWQPGRDQVSQPAQPILPPPPTLRILQLERLERLQDRNPSVRNDLPSSRHLVLLRRVSDQGTASWEWVVWA